MIKWRQTKPKWHERDQKWYGFEIDDIKQKGMDII